MCGQLFKSINNLLFSNNGVCLFCGSRDDSVHDYLCNDCRNKIEFLNKEIYTNSPYINKIVYSLFYNEFIKQKIYSYKYYGKGYLYKPLGKILVQTLKQKLPYQKIDLITYVPIHRRKKALRGYDQSELLAKFISKYLNIPLSKNNLIRIKRTTVQNKLNKRQRKENIKEAFKIKREEEFLDKEILLIDDIITTGSTVEECGKTIFESVGMKIYVLALTSGMKF